MFDRLFDYIKHPIPEIVTAAQERRRALAGPARARAGAALLALTGALALPATAEAQTPTTLVGNIGQTASAFNSTRSISQRFTTGANPSGYTLTGVDVASGAYTRFTARVCETDAGGHPTTRCTDLAAPASFFLGTMSFSAPANTTLRRNTTYAVVVHRAGGSQDYGSTHREDEDDGHAGGWSIADNYEYFGTEGWDTTTTDALRIAIKGYAAGGTTPACTLYPGDIWCGVVTVVTHSYQGTTFSGFSPNGGGLSSRTFNYGLNDDEYTITALGTASGTLDQFVLGLDKALPFADLENLVLRVGGELLSFSQPSIFGDPPGYIWYPTNQDWSSERWVTLRLRENRAAPVFSNSDDSVTLEVPENSAAGAAVGTPVTATDADSGDTLTYSLEGPDAASFTIVETSGQIRTGSGVTYNYEAPKNSYSVTVKADDDNGRAVTIDVTINVTDDDTEAPGAPGAPNVSAASVSSLTVTWAAPANDGPPITDYDYRYRRTAPPGAWTAVTGTTITGLSTTVQGLDDDTSYDVQVRATNAEGTGAWSASGRAAKASTSCTRDPGDIWCGVVTVVTHSYQGTTFSGFSPNGGGLSSRTFNYGLNDDEYTITALGTASGTLDQFVLGLDKALPFADLENLVLRVGSEPLSFSQPGIFGAPPDYIWYPTNQDWSSERWVTLRLRENRAAPVFSNSDDSVTLEVPENSAAGAAVGTPVTATDADSGDTLTYSLEGPDAASFTIVETSGQIRTGSGVTYNYEAPKNSYSVTVKADDDNGRAVTIDVTINVTDDDTEAPGAPGAPNVSAASVSSLTVTWAAPANDGPPITDYDYRYRRTAPPGAWTAVTGTTITGLSTTVQGLDDDTSYDVQVRATNAEGTGAWSASGRAATASTSCTRDPGDIWCGVVTVVTHSYQGTTFSGFSPNGGGLSSRTFNYGLNDDEYTITALGTASGTLDQFVLGLDKALPFADLENLVLRVGSEPLSFSQPGIFGAPPDYIWYPTNQDWSSERWVTLRLRENRAAPVFSNSDDSVTLEVPENSAAGAAVGTPVTATDADSGDTLTYSLEGPDAASFTIVETSGQIRTGSGVTYNYEAPKNSYSVTVKADDDNGRAVTIDVTINVTDDDTEAPGAPGAPNVSAASVSSLTVTWAAPANDGPPITDYDYRYRRTAPPGAWTAVTGTTITGLSTTVQGLDDDTSYDVQVRATNAEGTGAWSASGRAATASTSCTRDPGDIWCGVVTVVTHSYQGTTFSGFSPNGGGLSSRTFNYGLNDDEYTITALGTASGTLDQFVLGLDKALPFADLENLVLRVGSEPLSFSQPGIFGAPPDYIWYPTNQDWSSERWVTLRLRENSAAGIDVDTPLTVRFVGMPAAHRGEGGFKFRVAFSEDIGISFRALREDAFTVTGGRVTGGKRVDDRRDLFEMTVRPDSDDDVTITLQSGRECAVSGAICTKGENRRKLTNTVSATVAGPADDALPPNRAATGAPTISGTARVRERLTASPSGIADADGLDNASFAYQWIRNDTDIRGVTGATYTPVDADAGERLKVRVGFTDDAGNAESRTSAATDTVAAAPLTVRFVGMPAAHRGEGGFKFRVAFSEDIGISFRALREDAFTVTGGRVTGGKRVDDRRDLFEMTVRPDSDGDVTITLQAGRECAVSGAVCTKGENRRKLTNTVSATVQGPAVLSVADARAREGEDETIDFTVSLSRAATSTVTVAYASADRTARAGEDYTRTSGKLSFAPGETVKTVRVPVLDDAHDDGEETLILTLSKASGARIADGEAVGTIANADPLPKGWLARFGRTGATQVVGLLDTRFDEASSAASQLTLGGRSWRLSDLRGRAHRPAAPDRSAHADCAGGTGVTGPAAERPATAEVVPAAACRARMTGRAPGGSTDSAAVPAGGQSTFFSPASAGSTGAGAVLPGAARPDPAQTATPPHGAVRAGAEATWLERTVWGLLTRRDWSLDRRRFLSQSGFNLDLSGIGNAPDETEVARALPEPTGRWSAWGRGALTRFSGEDAGVRLDGDVLTGLLGVDYARARWLAGVALAYNDGTGTYRAPARGNSAGTLDSVLVSVHPYLQYQVTPRLSAWGALGYGEGELRLRPEHGTAGAGDGLKSVPGVPGIPGESESMETGMRLGMGALGLRGVVYASQGTELTVKSDALWVRTAAKAAHGLQAVDAADASRVRLLLSGRHERTLANAATLAPGFELGLRYDDGDAETGFGIELGGGLRYADPGRGLTLETRARTLLAHEDGGYEEWGLSGSLSLDPGRPGRGLALRLDSGWGSTNSGTEALWRRQTTAGLAPQHERAAQGRIRAEWGYGLDVPWTHGLLTPYGSLELSGGSRALRLGWRFELGRSLSLDLAGERLETAHTRPEHGLMLRTTLPW